MTDRSRRLPPHPRDQLSERDLAILSDLQRVRMLSARQVQRLHFTDGSAQTRARRSRRVLQRLFDHDLVVRLKRRVGGVHSGSAGHIYSLSSKGQQLRKGPGPAGGSRRRKPWEPSPHFIDHILEVSELYVLLREADHLDPDFELKVFDAEPTCWRRFANLAGAATILKPDAFAVVRATDAGGAYEQVSFVEVDRGTEHRPTIARKLGVYIDAFRSGVEQRGGAPFPNVVWIVPDEDRADLIRAETQRLPPAHAELFVATTNEPINRITHLKGGEQ